MRRLSRGLGEGWGGPLNEVHKIIPSMRVPFMLEKKIQAYLGQRYPSSISALETEDVSI
jgi:hypothetical protein